MNLLIATRNPDKLREIEVLFVHPRLKVISALDVPELPDVVEDGNTLEANAIKKAVTCALETGLWTLADDTGLEVKALNGRPGVYSARYAGTHSSYQDNCAKLLAELDGESDRAAQFRTVVALSSPTGTARTVDGACPGRIELAPCGDGGFGYDPLFVPDGYTETFAELDLEEKNRISHRGKAFRRAFDQWADLLAAEPDDWPLKCV